MSGIMVSYAQNREDVLLERLFKDQPTGTWIDVGAWDPIDDSVTKHFSGRGWRGINVEPQPELHARLVADRPRDTNLRLALGPRAGRARFAVRSQTGHSSLLQASEPLGAAERELDVEVETLATVCARHVEGPIDFLKVDVEGGERGVLEGGDWTRYRPRVVLVEATQPGSARPAWHDWEPLLLENGYLFAYFDGLNRYYLEGAERPLQRHFEVPVNVFDGFETHLVRRLERLAREAQAGEERLRHENATLRKELNQLHETLGRLFESVSWKLTEPLRSAGLWAARWRGVAGGVSDEGPAPRR